MGTPAGPSGSGRRGAAPPPIFKPTAEARRAQRTAAQKSKPGATAVRVVVGVVVVVLATGIMRSCSSRSGGGGVFSFLDRGASLADESAWHTGTLRGLTFESPVPLGADDDMLPDLPGLARDAIQIARKRMGNNAGDDFAIVATYLLAREGSPVDVEGAARGGIQGAAQSLGAFSVTPNVSTITVGGRTAYTASETVKAQGRTLMFHAIAVGGDSSVWCILVVHDGTRAAPDAERILASVRLDPTK